MGLYPATGNLKTWWRDSMAAQFEDEHLITESNKSQLFDIKNGLYNATIRQLNHPEHTGSTGGTSSNERADFEIILTPFVPENSIKDHIETIMWFAS